MRFTSSGARYSRLRLALFGWRTGGCFLRFAQLVRLDEQKFRPNELCAIASWADVYRTAKCIGTSTAATASRLSSIHIPHSTDPEANAECAAVPGAAPTHGYEHDEQHAHVRGERVFGFLPAARK